MPIAKQVWKKKFIDYFNSFLFKTINQPHYLVNSAHATCVFVSGLRSYNTNTIYFNESIFVKIVSFVLWEQLLKNHNHKQVAAVCAIVAVMKKRSTNVVISKSYRLSTAADIELDRCGVNGKLCEKAQNEKWNKNVQRNILMTFVVQTLTLKCAVFSREISNII